MKKTILFTLLAIIISISSTGQGLQVVSGATEGIVYTLPATAFIVNMTVERTDLFQGPLSEYARPLMGINNPIKKDDTSYRITSVEIQEITISDNATANTIGYSGVRSSRETVISSISLNPNGTLAGINTDKLQETSCSSYAFSLPSWSIKAPDFEFFMAGPNQVVETDTIVKMITIDTATIKDISYKQRLVERSEKDKANEIVDKILKIRSDRMSLLSGYQEVAYSAGTMQYMDEQFQKLENSYLSLFRGDRVSQEQKYSFVIIPASKDRNSKLAVCGFSESKGVSLSSTSGSTVDMVFSTEEIVVTNISKDEGVVYCIPATTRIVINHEGNSIGGGVFTVPQFGVKVSAPATGSPKVRLDPATGAATQIDIQ